MNINVEQLERELTAVVAAILNLTVDSGIYRGGIPETVENGVAVRITGQQTFADIDTPTFASDANSGAFADAARGSRL